MSKSLKAGEKTLPNKLGHDQANDQSEGATQVDQTGVVGDGQDMAGDDTLLVNSPELSSFQADKPKTKDLDILKKPMLLVEHDGRLAAVILNKRPSVQGLLYVRYDDSGLIEEVSGRDCRINSLTDSNQ
jgi:ParB family transcriptional regulator, chromosome partitioning protein